MLGKLVNGVVQNPPKRLIRNGMVVLNPPEEMLKEEGYKEVFKTDRPLSEDGFYFESSWIEGENFIQQMWTKKAYPVVEEPELVVEPENSLVDQLEKILTGRIE